MQFSHWSTARLSLVLLTPPVASLFISSSRMTMMYALVAELRAKLALGVDSCNVAFDTYLVSGGDHAAERSVRHTIYHT